MKQELVAVIDAQLAAFRSENYAQAYGFAAQSIKAIFPPDQFKQMVQTTYPLIAKSRSAEYGLALDTGEEAVIHVRVTGADSGQAAEYQYTLQKEDGAWRITGVVEVKATGLAV